MQINVALDGSRRRDLTLYAGDEQTLELTVYAADGDTEAIDSADVTDARIETLPSASVTIPVGSEFTVPDSLARAAYRLIAEVDGVTTTLAEGQLIVKGGTYSTRWDYGGAWYGGWL